MSKNKDIAKEERRLTDFAAALDAETVKITVIDSNGNKTEKEIDAEKINEQAEELSKMRENGCYISLEPKSTDRQYVVVSGLTELALAQMKKDGYAPAVAIEAEEGKYQALFKVNNGPQGKLEQLRETLCNRYGDGVKHESIAVPGHYYNSRETFPRVITANPAASDLGAARLLDRLNEQAPQYQEQEKNTAEKVKAAEKTVEHKHDKLSTLLKSVFKQDVQGKENIIGNGKEAEAAKRIGKENITEAKEPELERTQQGKKEDKEHVQEDKQESTQEQQKSFGLFEFLGEILKMVMRLMTLAAKAVHTEMNRKGIQEQATVPSMWDKGRPGDEQFLANTDILKDRGKEKAAKVRTVAEIANAAVEVEKQRQADVAAIKGGEKRMENAHHELKAGTKDKGLSL